MGSVLHSAPQQKHEERNKEQQSKPRLTHTLQQSVQVQQKQVVHQTSQHFKTKPGNRGP